MVDRRFSRRDFLKAGGVGIAGATLFGAAACGGEEQGETGGQQGKTGLVNREDIRLTMVTHGPAADPFWSIVINGVEQAESDMGVQVDYRSPDTFDVVEIQRLMEAAIAANPDGLAVSIADPDAFSPLVRQAIDKGIPVAVLNAGLEVWEDLGALTYVGQTEFEAGVAAGERMAQEGVNNAFCINQQQGVATLEQRCAGFEKGLGGNVEQVAVQGDDPTAARNAILTTLRNNPDVGGMLTLGPQGALPALEALKQYDRSDEIVFATFDLGPEILSAVQEGRMLFAIDQQQFLQGYLPVVFLTTYAQYRVSPVDEVATGPRIVTQQEADEVIELTKQGIR